MAIDDPVGGVLARDSLINLNAYWKSKRFAYDGSDNLIYIGFHYKPKVATSDSDWAILKFTYTSSNITLIEGPQKGSWDNRATLDWV